jgi:hypothetical protein
VDADARLVNREAKPITIGELRNFDRPDELNRNRHGFAGERIAPLETQVWSLRARVLQIYRRPDGDYYLVIESNGLRGCVEAPDPSGCEASIFYRQIKQVRDQLDAVFRISSKALVVNREAQLTGVGFYGTGGLRDNGARLHPLLSLEWVGER